MDRNVRLTGDSASLVSALNNASQAMVEFRKQATGTKNGITELSKLNLVDNKALQNNAKALYSLAQGAKALEKIKLGVVVSNMQELSKVKVNDNFSGKLASISENVGSLNRRLNATKNALQSFQTAIAAFKTTDVTIEGLDQESSQIVKVLRNNLESLEPVLNNLATRARELATQLRSIGINKISQIQNGFSASAISARELVSQIQRGERSVDSLTDAERQLIKEQQNLVEANRRWINALKEGESAQAAMTSQARKLVSDFNRGLITLEQMTKEERELLTNIIRATNENKKFVNQVQRANKASGEINITWESIARYWITGTVIGQVRQFTQQIQQAVLDAADLSVKLAEIQTIANNGISSSDLAVQVRELSDTFTGSTADQAEAFYQALSNGVVEASNAQRFLITSNKLALASVTDVGAATNLLSSIINSYSLATEEATRISDVFFKAVELGRFRLGEIANTIGRTTIIASQVGASYTEVAASLAFLTKQGTNAATAQTLIRNVMLKLIKPTEETKNILNDLGFESGEALVQAKGLGGALLTLFEQTNGGSTEIAKLFNNVRGLQGALALGRNGLKDYNAVLAELTDSYDAADIAANKVANSLGKQFIVSLEQVQNSLTQDLGNTILETLADADGSFDSLTESIINVIKVVTPLLSLFVATAKTLKPVIISVTALGVAYTTYRAIAISTSLVQTAIASSFGQSVIAILNETRAVIANTGAKRANIGSSAQATIASRAYAGAANASAVAAGAAAVSTRSFSTALKGLLATTGVGLILVGLGLAIEGLAVSFDETSESSREFSKTLEDQRSALEESSQQVLRLSENNNKLIKSIRSTEANIKSVYVRLFSSSLKETVKLYTDLIDKQEAYATLFGKSLDGIASKSVSLVKALDEVIRKTDEALGRGSGDSTLLKTLDRDLEILKAELSGLFTPFDQIDNVADRFKLIENALKQATDPTTVSTLISKLKSLAQEQSSLSIGNPTDISDELVNNLQKINKLEDEANLRINQRAKAQKVISEQQSLQLNNTKEQVKRLAEQIVAEDKIAENIGQLTVDSEGKVIYDNTAIGETRKAIQDIVNLIDAQIKKAPEYTKELNDQKNTYLDRFKAINEIVEKNKELIRTQTESNKLQADAANLERENIKLSNERIAAERKLADLQSNIGRLSVGQGLDAASDILGVLAENNDTFKDLPDDIRNLDLFKNFGDYLQGLELSLDSILQGSFENAIRDAQTELKVLSNVVTDAIKNQDPEAIRKQFSQQATKDAITLFANIQNAIALEVQNINELAKQNQITEKDAAKRRRQLATITSGIGLGDLNTQTGDVSGFQNILGQGVAFTSENLQEALLNQITTTQKATEAFNVVNTAINTQKDKIIEQTNLINAQIATQTSLNDINSKLSGTTEGLNKAFESLKGLIESISVNGNVTNKYMGGRIYGPSGIDRVPAMLTAGEFVMPKNATERYLPLLESMRRGSYAPPQYFAQGGLVGTGPTQSLDQSVSVGDINVTVQSSGAVNAREIAQAINAEIRSGAVRIRR